MGDAQFQKNEGDVAGQRTHLAHGRCPLSQCSASRSCRELLTRLVGQSSRGRDLRGEAASLAPDFGRSLGWNWSPGDAAKLGKMCLKPAMRATSSGWPLHGVLLGLNWGPEGALKHVYLEAAKPFSSTGNRIRLGPAKGLDACLRTESDC